MANCGQACPYNTLDGCKVKEYKAICPLTNMATPITEAAYKNGYEDGKRDAVKHGRWLYDSGSGKYFCSACDEDALSFKKDVLYGCDLYDVCLTDYCPHCGAKMDEEGEANG